MGTFLPNKIIRFDELTPDDEPRIVPVYPGYRNGMYKHASSDALDYCSGVQPEDGYRYVLVLAMSAGEFYGPNRNGDAFSEGPIQGNNGAWLVAPGETLLDYYKTFEDQATVFKHHINKDPKKGYGEVAQAFYNHNMHRVELLLKIDMHKAAGQFFMRKIEAGEYPGVSMGCRIKYDVCSICGNHAPTRADYCEHVSGKNPAYGMNRLLENGERCFVWNPCPNLFDISFVFKPADRIGYMMRKVAGASRPYEIFSGSPSRDLAEIVEKHATLNKISEIDKVVHGQSAKELVPGMPSALSRQERESVSYISDHLIDRKRGYRDIPDTLVIQVKSKPLPVTASSMISAGVVPSARDITKILFSQWDMKPPTKILDAVGASQGFLADLLKGYPSLLESNLIKAASAVDPSLVDPVLRSKVAQEMEDRSLWLDKVMRENVPESYGGSLSSLVQGGSRSGKNPYRQNTQQLLHYQDPQSGQIGVTTRQAAENADLLNKKKLVAEGVGAAALLGVGLKTLAGSSSPKMKALLGAPAIAGSGVLGWDVMKGQRVPKVTTQEGVRIPVNTEMSEKLSAFGPTAGAVTGAGALTLLAAQDLYGRPELSRRIDENKGQFFVGASVPLGITAHYGPDIVEGVKSTGSDTYRSVREALENVFSRAKKAGLLQQKESSYTELDPPADGDALVEKLAGVVGHALIEAVSWY